MRKVLLAFAILAVAAFGFVAWHPVLLGTRATAVGTSQIFIHGTPVCVMKQGDSILARVGECGRNEAGPDGGFAERAPFHGDPGLDGRLPPGHPPIPDGMIGGGERRIPI